MSREIPRLTAKQIINFWSKVNHHPGLGPAGDCWKWIGWMHDNRYGGFDVGAVTCLAHRVSYAISHGRIPRGMCVLHSCDEPSCVNPAHLWLGTQADNMRDMRKKGRASTGEHAPRGEQVGNSKLSELQVLEIRDMYAGGGYMQRQLAGEFGVSGQLISRIVRREIWTHI